jgi:hypothetical protein
MQVKCKWCKDNFKHKLYMACNLWEEHHSRAYNILYDFPQGLHPNNIFSHDSQVGVPKLGLLLSQNFGRSYLFQNKFVLNMQRQYFIDLKKIFPKMYFMLQFEII